MSPRQRWMVLYPLLTLAVCLGVKHEWQWMSYKSEQNNPKRVLQVGAVRAQELEICDEQGRRMVLVCRGPDGNGWITVYGGKNAEKPLVALHTDSDGRIGVVETVGLDGRPVVQIAGNDQGGTILLPGAKNRPTMFLGHDREFRVTGTLLYGPDGTINVQQIRGKRIPVPLPILLWPDEPAAEKPDQNGVAPAGESPGEKAPPPETS